MTEKLELAKRLADAMHATKTTKAMLARAQGVSPQAVGKWVKTGTISQENLLAAAEYMGIEPGWLLTGNGPMLSGVLPTGSDAVRLTPDEIKLLGQFRRMKKKERDCLLRIGEALAGNKNGINS